jgi:branched-chain amino acid transport system permease protein
MIKSDRRHPGRWVPELAMVAALAILPFVFDIQFGSVDLLTRILIWSIFGLGFDLLFGYCGLLSFGQAAFYGTGGFTAAYLLTSGIVTNVWLGVAAGVAAATLFSVIVGLLALRRVGIYFAMITLAFGELSYFLENSPLSNWTGGENGLPGVPAPSFQFGSFDLSLAGSWPTYCLVATFYFVGFLLARFVVLSAVGSVLSGIRENPERTAALGHDVHAYKLVVFVLAAVYAGIGGALLGIFQGYMPPSAFALQTSGQLVIQTVIGGTGTLIGPAIGAAIWLYLRDVLQEVAIIGDLWKFILGFVFVLMVTVLPHGVAGTVRRLLSIRRSGPSGLGLQFPARTSGDARFDTLLAPIRTAAVPAHGSARFALDVRDVSKFYGGVGAVDQVSVSIAEGSLHAIIGPNGAGKSTLLRLLAGEETADSGAILLHGSDITSLDVTSVCQRGLSKSYQLNQLYTRLTVRENLRIGVLGRHRGRIRLDILRSARGFVDVERLIVALLERIGLVDCADVPVQTLAYGQKRRLELGLALSSRPSVLLLDEPLAGLSPSEREDIKYVIRALHKGRSVVLVEHDMDAVFELAERITVLHEGRRLAEGSPFEIRNDSQVQDAYFGGVTAP